MEKYALIPAFNPDARLIALCEALRQLDYRMVVVDDGSDAACAEVFAQAASMAIVLRHAANRGKGAALKTGLRAIREAAQPDDVVVTADADGQHKPADVERVAQAALSRPEALVLGSRSFSGRVPFRSKMGNRITRVVYQAVAHCRVSDTQTGLRAFSCAQIPLLAEIPGDRYEYEMNVLLQCPRRGIPICEIPIETVYIDENASSHFRPLADACRIYRQLLRFAGSSLAGFAVDYLSFGLLSRLLGGVGPLAIPASNVLARLISATVNFSLNRRYVFHDRGGRGASAARYALLALGILAGNTLVLTALTAGAGINRYLAKLVTEALFFVLSWSAQRRFVFKGPSSPTA